MTRGKLLKNCCARSTGTSLWGTLRNKLWRRREGQEKLNSLYWKVKRLQVNHGR